jgi:HEPN domain-containing protein
MEQKELIDYLISSSDDDFKAMLHSFQSKDYNWSLFIGHIVIEKLLKAYCIKQKNESPPYIHDLLRIAEKAGLSLTEEEKDLLDTITAFNIQARYDDYKKDFIRKCTLDYTQKQIEKIENG